MIVTDTYANPAPIAAACQDCMAGAGAPCAEDCTSAAAAEHEAISEEFENVSDVCCPSPQYAAATLCGCGGLSARSAA